MHIICPNCGLKSPVEAGGLAVETRLVCTRCEVEVDITFTDEPGAEAATTEIALFESFAETLEEKLGLPAPILCEPEPGDVLGLGLLPTPPETEGMWETENLVLEEAQPLVLEPQPRPEIIDSLVSTQFEDEDVEEAAAARPAHDFERAPARAAQSFDKYNVGVRLMQASPVWLLVSGLSFISFIVLCNWFFVPNYLAQAETQRPAARGNHATNLSAEQSVALPARPAAEVADAVEDSPAATQTVEPSVQTIEQPTPEPAPASTPLPAKAQTVAPAAEPAPAPAANPAPEGKFTLQVGSYNVAAEAQARASSLRAAGVEARVAQVEIPKRGTWYRVQAGRFASREEAERNGRQLREKNLAASYLTAAL